MLVMWEPLFWYQTDPLFYSISINFVNLYHLSLIGISLILIGIFGIFFYSWDLSFVHLLLLLELILLGFSLITIVVTYVVSNPLGFLLVYFLLTLAAAESAIGLSLLILFYRVREDTLLVGFNRICI
jgi:NADH-quinone oxidoreductase subunit K